MNEITLTNSTDTPVVRQADSDEQLIGLWLHGRPAGTTSVYQAVCSEFKAYCDKPLRSITLGNIQSYADVLVQRGLKPATIFRKLSVIKSLFGFGHKLGYFVFDPARAVRLPGRRNALSNRILDEAEVHELLESDPNPRNALLLATIYVAGLRVSEACGLTWGDVRSTRKAGQITVLGKGDKIRSIALPRSVFTKLMSMRGEHADTDPVFMSRKGGHLRPVQVWRIVRKAAHRAGLSKPVSTHWLRHAHASHALDNGAPISLVQATLGHVSLTTTSVYVHSQPDESSADYITIEGDCHVG